MIHVDIVGNSLDRQDEQAIFHDPDLSDEAWLSTMATVNIDDWR